MSHEDKLREHLRVIYRELHKAQLEARVCGEDGMSTRFSEMREMIVMLGKAIGKRSPEDAKILRLVKT